MKRGSLQLSIQAIVIIVLAMTLLGLGLGFVRKQFATIGETGSQVQEQIRQQILDDLRTGDKKLSFPATQIVLNTNEESVQAIGIKNTEDSELSFSIQFEVKDGAELLPFESQIELTLSNGAAARIDWDDSPQTLKQGESRVFPITLKAPSNKGNYLYKIKILQADGIEYESRTFFVKTS